jgi:hypothetical protein
MRNADCAGVSCRQRRRNAKDESANPKDKKHRTHRTEEPSLTNRHKQTNTSTMKKKRLSDRQELGGDGVRCPRPWLAAAPHVIPTPTRINSNARPTDIARAYATLLFTRAHAPLLRFAQRQKSPSFCVYKKSTGTSTVCVYGVRCGEIEETEKP